MIEKEKQYAGYGAIVTDLFDESVTDIINIASRRWEIEDCFRQMKTGFSTRPIYLRTIKHIHAHFLTCYVALTIVKLLENKYLKGITSNNLFEVLRNTTFVKLPTGDWMAGNISKEAVQSFKKMGFNNLLFNYLSNKTFIKHHPAFIWIKAPPSPHAPWYAGTYPPAPPFPCGIPFSPDTADLLPEFPVRS